MFCILFLTVVPFRPAAFRNSDHKDSHLLQLTWKNLCGNQRHIYGGNLSEGKAVSLCFYDLEMRKAQNRLSKERIHRF